MTREAAVDIQSMMTDVGARARRSARVLAAASPAAKDGALAAIARALRGSSDRLSQANRLDISAGREGGLSPAMLDRLLLTPDRIEQMARSLEEVAALPDPVGEVTRMWIRPAGFRVGRMRVPIGVVAVIFESRPNVTVDAAALCVKSGNACILRGGSEAIHSNRALAEVVRDGLEEAGLPRDAVQVVPTTDRAAVSALLTLDRYVDLVIPRGGKGLIRTIMETSTIPVIKHLDGICATFVDESADLLMARRVCVNAKVNRPGTCNAMETMLVHRGVAAAFLPGALDALRAEGVEVRGCPETLAVAPWAKPATDADWDTEFLDKILAVKVVGGIEEAMEHIASHGSAHTDVILTNNHRNAERFVREVDSAAVMVNASSRLHDGFVFGLGAEIGISTDKLHARGPMGLEELTTQKFVVLGDGHVRE